MATIFFYRNNSDVETFYKSNITNPTEEVEFLNNEDDNFIDGEQICFFKYTNADYLEHEFYGFNSKEEMFYCLNI